MAAGTMHLTCIFKLRPPTARKRAVLEHALREYTLGYQRLLDWARAHEAVLREQGRYNGKYTGLSIAALLPRPDADLHSSACDSLRADVAGTLASYCALKETAPDTGFPDGRDLSSRAYEAALDQFIGVGASELDYNQSRDRLLLRSQGQYMPFTFGRADGATRNRNFSLLWNTGKRQLLAALWLLPQGHALGAPLQATQGNLARVDTGDVFRSNSRSAILVPLELGDNGWQEHKFLWAALERRGAVKSAALVARDGDYWLHVAFAFACPEVYAPESYLGINKGVIVTAAYAAVDRDGALVECGHFHDRLRALQEAHGQWREQLQRDGQRVGRWHWKKRSYENILHGLANLLLAEAQRRRAAIVVDDITVAYRTSRVASRFRTLDRILAYKCKLAGVPYRRVFTANLSTICSSCGERLTHVDHRQKVAVCAACGYQGHPDENAAINTARRALYRKADWADYEAFHRSFRTSARTIAA